MRADGADDEDLTFDELLDEVLVHALVAGHGAVLVAGALHLVPPLDHRVTVVHLRVACVRRAHVSVHFVLEDLVDVETRLPSSHRVKRPQRLLDELQLVGELEDGGVRDVALEVGILVPVARQRQRKPHPVRRVLLDRLLEGLEVARGLGHLFVVKQHVPVRAHRPRPVLFGEDGTVVVEEERQVVLDKVLARHPEVDGVPVVKLALHLVQHLLGDLGVSRESLVEQHVVPHTLCEVLWRDVAFTWDGAIEGALLEDVAEGVIRHVDC
mmetsp:Transcript_58912/g.120581  ORF Transcript_58912/g.120581 Transcript_58912/m.120581 type:complete len:268 (+) Transcript_58912:793-1596(+)